MEPELSQEMVRKLIEEAKRVKKQAYSRYSNFRVGAALLTSDDCVFTGCNVENACFNLGTCAERNAITKAVSEGHRHFKAIAISSDMKDQFIVPCGGCRQFMSEFGLSWEIFMSKPDGSFKRMSMKELLPLSFGPKDLNRSKETDH